MEPLKNMPKLTYADEKREVEYSEAQSILEISNEKDIPLLTFLL